MRLACLYTTARLFILSNETKWEISSEVRKIFFDPCKSVAFCWEQARFMAYTAEHPATTAGCGDIKRCSREIPMQIYSADGELIAQYGEKRRIPVMLDQIPPDMVKAFIATKQLLLRASRR